MWRYDRKKISTNIVVECRKEKWSPLYAVHKKWNKTDNERRVQSGTREACGVMAPVDMTSIQQYADQNM